MQAARGLPDALDVLGARRLVVEVHVAVVGPAGAGAQQRVDGPERAAQVARAEAQVLVEARTVLAVEVDVEQLAVPQRLGDALREVQPGHLLVPDLGVEARPGRARSSSLMNASACPIVGSRMSPRGSFGLGSRANRMS